MSIAPTPRFFEEPEVNNNESQAQESDETELSQKIDKQSVLYLHISGTDYECKDCGLFINDKERCFIHGTNDVIKDFGSCGLFIYGEPLPNNVVPVGILSKEESGYVESEQGYSCKRCEYFNSPLKDCQKVNKDSVGVDEGMIHLDACCNAWESLDA